MALEQWKIADMTLTWLNGGVTHMDGGAMFGVVPKPLWERKYPFNERNQIELRTDPILIQVEGRNILVETGIGNGKFSEKAMRNFGITEEAKLEESLALLGLTADDIDDVLMTHMHFDHASGAAKWEKDTLVPMFANATFWIQEIEWEELKKPNIRSKNTYFEANWQPIAPQVKTFRETAEVVDGIQLIHTGGHSAGHCIVNIERGGEKILHMADLMPTHAHQNVLWVLAYDDYPMESIAAKQKYLLPGIEESAWFIFYHDYKYRALKWDKEGKTIEEAVLRKSGTE
ncbi:Glyoxylase, beta-lactamase superfamily II [Evansella caseinilytica]|uniref:Glyoxylase, beta-lactamase superfamily II n=1 Tax=Evansella caseinilytica TaxID=1503961 RepID=A0A1H3RUC9_9BACI|nr:MBL fold metallo-hydrolase [Evansella caseinilytica]SDZ29242.1 Glyoxylase, beta-lactamase superfamily II [Evansella caseinilytica]